jgi:hypothetical protein
VGGVEFSKLVARGMEDILILGMGSDGMEWNRMRWDGIERIYYQKLLISLSLNLGQSGTSQQHRQYGWKNNMRTCFQNRVGIVFRLM